MSVLSTRRGVLTLLLLCAVQFIDIIDSSIMNVALPSIRAGLGFSQQRLQWVLSGYLVTYGGFLLLGGRAADLVGRRRVLVAGTALFATCSLAGGLATSAGALVGARVAQGVGAALMAPAGLSILTTTFTEGRDRTRALGVWGAISGVAAAAGVFLGGVLAEGPGWRWVLFVNIPVCLLIIAAAFALVPGERRHARLATFDLPGAVLSTAGMLLLIYALVKAPDAGWATRHTIGELGTAAALLAAFVVVERRARNPLVPFGILRVKGLAAADATQLIAFAGFLSTFFFLTLYMPNVLGYPPIRSGSAYLPVTAGIVLAAGLLNTFLQLGSALGLAVFSALATARTDDTLAAGAAPAAALTAGFGRALFAGGIALFVAALFALRATNTRGHTATAVPTLTAAT